jgi:hypothetical protein
MKEKNRKEIINTQDKSDKLGIFLVSKLMYDKKDADLLKKMAYVAYRTAWIDALNIDALNSKSMEDNFNQWVSNIFGI